MFSKKQYDRSWCTNLYIGTDDLDNTIIICHQVPLEIFSLRPLNLLIVHVGQFCPEREDLTSSVVWRISLVFEHKTTLHSFIA
jgi:hypothetical protein